MAATTFRHTGVSSSSGRGAPELTFILGNKWRLGISEKKPSIRFTRASGSRTFGWEKKY